MQDEQSLGDAADVIEDEESQRSEDDLPGTEYQQNRKKKNKEEGPLEMSKTLRAGDPGPPAMQAED